MCACTAIRHCVRMCLYPRRSNGCRCRWGIGGEDRIGRREAGWTSLARLRRRAKGGEERSAVVRTFSRRGDDPVGRPDGKGRAREPFEKGCDLRRLSASPRGDRAHAFLAGSQKSAGARLALGCLSASFPPPSPYPFPPNRPALRRSSSAVSEFVISRSRWGPPRGHVKGRRPAVYSPSFSFSVGEPIARRTNGV